MGSVTLSEVAKHAGVSLATASRAINGSSTRTVRPELRARVLAAAAELDYTPDANAQAMARGHTTTLGLIVHDIADPYFAAIAAGVGSAAEEAGLIVTLAATGHVLGREVQFIEMLHGQRARAVIIAGGRYDDEEALADLSGALARYRAGGGSVATIGQALLGGDAVVVGNTSGAADLARRLHGIGYRRFGILAGPASHITARDRRSGFETTLAELGSPVEQTAVLTCPFTRDGGYAAMSELLGRTRDLDAVFAVNDVMAMGAMAAARDAGLRVGSDIGVAGFDDIATLRDVTPSLTTVRLPLHELGVRATELALSHAGAEDQRVHIEGAVVLRDSTPPLER